MEYLYFHEAHAAARELTDVTVATHIHELRSTPRLVRALAPIFESDTASQNFNVDLWKRILMQSYRTFSSEKDESPEVIYQTAKQEYEILERVADPMKTVTDGEIQHAKKFCNGIDRGSRRHQTGKRFEGGL